MKRSLWLIFVALVLITAGIRFQYEPEKLAIAAPLDATLPEIRVQHEFVYIPKTDHAFVPREANRRAATEPHSVVTPSPRPIHKAPAAAATRPTVQRANRERTILEKAGRALLGDGRYRPEPFPRIR